MKANKGKRQRIDVSIVTQNTILSDVYEKNKKPATKGPVMTLVDLIKNGHTEEEAIEILKETYRTIENEWIIAARHIVKQKKSNTSNKERAEEKE